MSVRADDPGRILLIGAGGLVGRHVHAAARATGVAVSTVVVPWDDPEASLAALTGALAAYLDPPGGPSECQWGIVWAAGAGVVATPAAELEAERDVFAGFMAEVEARCAGRDGGAFVLVSSAGGVYAGSAGAPFTEDTPPRPLVAYGRVKLAMEESASAACRRTRMPLLIARPANVYGPGQRLLKPQGLISQIARAHLTGAPLPVTVAQDTVRDYVYAADAAALLLAGLRRLHAERPVAPVVKIAATGLGVSVGHLIGEARRVLRRPLRTVGVAGRGRGQVLDLRFRSTVWPELDACLRTPLPAGLAATAHDVRARVAAGGDLDARG